MNKSHIGLMFGIFAIASFLAVNMYTSTSFPGFDSGASCTDCHNAPLFIKTAPISINLNNMSSDQVFSAYQQYATNEVQVVQTNNRSLSNVEFIRITVLRNATHLNMYADVPDNTYISGSTKSNSDKFAIIWNIDVADFSLGDFINSYNSSAPVGSNVDGQMKFTNGHADMWYVDTSINPINATGKASDMYINTVGYASDGASNQDVSLGYYFLYVTAHGTTQGHYRIFMTRALTDSDANDVQFKNDGRPIYYAVAVWNNDRYDYHMSSFDNMVIDGDSVAMPTTITVTKTGSASGTTSSFTIVFVLAGLMIAVPLISKLRHKPE